MLQLDHNYDQKMLKTGFDVLFALYLALGLFGAAWIDFDFNEIYVQAVAYVVIPAIAFYYGMKWLYPQWHSRFPRSYRGLLLGLVLAVLPAQVLLINAATNEGGLIKRDIARSSGLLTVAVERGGLGILYRKRW